MSSMTREEKLSTYRMALLVLLREVQCGGKPAFGVCGSLDNILRVHPGEGLDGYVFCLSNANAWEHAVRTDTVAVNGKFLADAYFVPPRGTPSTRWVGEGQAKREQFMRWLLDRIDSGEAFIDEEEAEAAGWARADSGKVHDEC